jgi:hypothetical protein
MTALILTLHRQGVPIPCIAVRLRIKRERVERVIAERRAA